MKKIIKISVLIGLLISCSNEKEAINSTPQEITVVPQVNFRGAISEAHPFYKVIYSDYNNIQLKDIDKAYKNHVLNDINKDYTTNLKNEAFLLLVSKGLIKNGSVKQKKFYIKEQQDLILNLPCIAQFYSLLLSCHNFMKWDEMQLIAKTFYEKNKIVIETSEWPNKDEQKSSAALLESGYQDFYTNSLFINK